MNKDKSGFWKNRIHLLVLIGALIFASFVCLGCNDDDDIMYPGAQDKEIFDDSDGDNQSKEDEQQREGITYDVTYHNAYNKSGNGGAANNNDNNNKPPQPPTTTGYLYILPNSSGPACIDDSMGVRLVNVIFSNGVKGNNILVSSVTVWNTYTRKYDTYPGDQLNPYSSDLLTPKSVCKYSESGGKYKLTVDKEKNKSIIIPIYEENSTISNNGKEPKVTIDSSTVCVTENSTGDWSASAAGPSELGSYEVHAFVESGDKAEVVYFDYKKDR